MKQLRRGYGGRTRIIVVLAAALLVVGVVRLRVWNPGRNEPREQREGEDAAFVETLVEVDEAEAERAMGWLCGHMEAAGRALLPDVPVVVEAAIGADWSAKA
jgi:hypothetical protein